MKAAIYIRVGNKDQLEPDTNIEKNRQKSENYIEEKQAFIEKVMGSFSGETQKSGQKRSR